MKKLTYLIILYVSILLVPLVLGIWYVAIRTSNYYDKKHYTAILNDNKKLFESAAEMLLEGDITKNLNIQKKPEFQELSIKLREKCRVDKIYQRTSTETAEYTWVVFLLDNSYESNYRDIRYQPQNQFPEVSASNYTKRISENWFYNAYPKSQRTLQHYLIIICPTVFVISVWSVGIVKITKTLVKKQKGRTNKLV